MALPSLPDRGPMFDEDGKPTLQTRVWWQAVKREYDALEARVRALEP